MHVWIEDHSKAEGAKGEACFGKNFVQGLKAAIEGQGHGQHREGEHNAEAATGGANALAGSST